MKYLNFQFYTQLFLLVIVWIALVACRSAEPDQTIQSSFLSSKNQVVQLNAFDDTKPQPAAENFKAYQAYLSNKKAGLIVNHTSTVNNVHLVDYLLDKNINIKKIFTPEHGFKGTADAGEKVFNNVYKNIDIVSLYGKNKKPTAEQLNGLEVLVFDMQDVGARFYTYISTMHFVMEAAAEQHIPVVVLDRPNPNGHYVDGPVRTPEFESFIAQHPIPVVHGMTIGELAKMINAEAWLADGVSCDLTVIPCNNYTHQKNYTLPIKPSPNLPNQRSIYLYPGLCFFEGTVLSIGRGTDKQFQLIGHPSLKEMPFQFTPVSSPGAKYPKLENEACFGVDLTTLDEADLFKQQQLDISWLLKMYEAFDNKSHFFLENGFFDKLAGTTKLRQQIIDGLTEQQIRTSWQAGIDAFKAKRKQYLLYPDFE